MVCLFLWSLLVVKAAYWLCRYCAVFYRNSLGLQSGLCCLLTLDKSAILSVFLTSFLHLQNGSYFIEPSELFKILSRFSPCRLSFLFVFVFPLGAQEWNLQRKQSVWKYFENCNMLYLCEVKKHTHNKHPERESSDSTTSNESLSDKWKSTYWSRMVGEKPARSWEGLCLHDRMEDPESSLFWFLRDVRPLLFPALIKKHIYICALVLSFLWLVFVFDFY